LYIKRACELNKSHIISTDEDPGLRIESFAIINLRGVSTNKTIIYFLAIMARNRGHLSPRYLRSGHSNNVLRIPEYLQISISVLFKRAMKMATVKVIPQFCIAHFYCAHLITYNFIHYTYRLIKKSFYDNFMLLQNIFGYIRAKNYVKINVFKKGIQKCS
jgi:hypothetical protein